MRADHPNGAHTAYGCQGGRLRTLAHFDAGGADNCAYDGRGRRLSKTVAGQLRESLYDGQQIVAEHDSRGQPLVSYSHRLGLDEVLMQHRGADTRYHHTGPQSQHPCAYALISPTNDADATGKSVRVE